MAMRSAKRGDQRASPYPKMKTSVTPDRVTLLTVFNTVEAEGLLSLVPGKRGLIVMRVCRALWALAQSCSTHWSVHVKAREHARISGAETLFDEESRIERLTMGLLRMNYQFRITGLELQDVFPRLDYGAYRQSFARGYLSLPLLRLLRTHGKSLEVVDLRGIKCAGDLGAVRHRKSTDAMFVQTALDGCTALTYLDLSYGGDEWTNKLFNVSLLQRLTSLKTLKLRGCDLGYKAGKQLAEALTVRDGQPSACPSLQILDVGGNYGMAVNPGPNTKSGIVMLLEAFETRPDGCYVYTI